MRRFLVVLTVLFAMASLVLTPILTAGCGGDEADDGAVKTGPVNPDPDGGDQETEEEGEEG